MTTLWHILTVNCTLGKSMLPTIESMLPTYYGFKLRIEAFQVYLGEKPPTVVSLGYIV